MYRGRRAEVQYDLQMTVRREGDRHSFAASGLAIGAFDSVSVSPERLEVEEEDKDKLLLPPPRSLAAHPLQTVLSTLNPSTSQWQAHADQLSLP